MALLPPPSSTIGRSLPQIDYSDAYRRPLPAQYSAEAVARAVFQQAPGWVSVLMRLRNAIVQWLGLRRVESVAPAQGRTAAAGAHAPGSPFQIFSATPNEVVLGLNDRHLDFRVAVMVEPAAESQATAWVCTAVQFHNGWGRAYFALIRPFHALIVRTMLRMGVNRLRRATTEPAF